MTRRLLSTSPHWHGHASRGTRWTPESGRRLLASMAPMPLALSVHKFISSVGADAGFAAIIGLAILVLLYFAHARETANLREQAALLTQRLQQAEARVAQLSRAQSAAAPIQAGAPAQAAASPV